MSDMVSVASELHRLGARDIFGIPGEGPSLELVHEFECRGGAFHAVCHEAAGALMAGGYARVTGMPAVCLSIKGPGFSNMLAGIASNWLDRNPVLSLSESYGPTSLVERMHKRLPHAALVRPVVKAYADNPCPEMLSELWSVSMGEEPGPVHVDISNTMIASAFDGPASGPDLQPMPKEAVALIKSASRPLVIAGELAGRRAWGRTLSALHIPVFTTVAAKGVLDETTPWSAGVFTNAGGPAAPECNLLRKADLIVGLGLRTTELLNVSSFPCRLLLLDELSNRGDGLGATLECVVKEEAVREVLDLLEEKEWGVDEVTASKKLLTHQMGINRWLPAGVLTVLQSSLPRHTRFVLDTGNFCTIAEHILAARFSGQVVGSTRARSMGAAIPTGIGAALATKHTQTVIIVGDGGVRMYPETVALALRHQLPVLIVLMNDGTYSSIRQAAVKKGYSQASLCMQTYDWASVFEGFGCPSQRINSFPALIGAVAYWVHNAGPLFLNLEFNAESYLSMTEGIR
jgi:thiamine pyrophosphate-dependent acetolactate synthase large subunit-like protein